MVGVSQGRKEKEMIIVRDIFQLHFGKAREAIELFREGRELLRAEGYAVDRILTDVTGEYYTVVMESSHPNLGDFEAAMNNPGMERWREIYSRIVPLVRSGRREVFRQLD